MSQGSAPYQALPCHSITRTAMPDSDDQEFFSDTGFVVKRKPFRSSKVKGVLPPVIPEAAAESPAGTVWACCLGAELLFDDLLTSFSNGVVHPQVLSLDSSHSEVLFCRAFNKAKMCFLFKFGCVVGWDFTKSEHQDIVSLLRPFTEGFLGSAKQEEDDMNYIWAERPAIKRDHMHLVTSHPFERLAYSYAFSQSVKLAVFETVVSDTIDNTKKIPEGLARTGNVNSNRLDLSRQIGKLFVNRFYINLHTDILDTPDIFWDNDDFADHYDTCRLYLEIKKRAEILNHRLDIIKDLYDMLNNELSIQHGYKLEWIVIYLICVEVIIEVVWNILIKDILQLV
eukprot:GHVS01045446.1.p1 GENE.GHVS01045446.1~~GHVS01045446.1.p1  ORF type:complete len:340 (+),score=27.44 GHVS01045446.1:147-1166(+)